MANQFNYHNSNNLTITGNNTYQADPFLSLASPNFGYIFPNNGYVQLSPRKVSYQPNTLGTTVHVYTSPNYQDMISLANYFADWGCAYEIVEGPVHTMTVNIPWDTITSEDFYVSLYASEQWELTPMMDTKPLLANGLLVNSFEGFSASGNYIVLPDVLKVAVQSALDNKTDLFLPSGSASSSLAPYFPTAVKTLNYLRYGIEGIPAYHQVLKRTAVIDKNNKNDAFNTAIDNELATINAQGSVNFILSTDDLKSNYSIPSDTVAKFLLPSYSKQISVSGLDQYTLKTWAGWLVKQPTFAFIGRNKVQLTQEFVWNEWADGLYYIYSDSTDFPLVSVPT